MWEVCVCRKELVSLLSTVLLAFLLSFFLSFFLPLYRCRYSYSPRDLWFRLVAFFVLLLYLTASSFLGSEAILFYK